MRDLRLTISFHKSSVPDIADDQFNQTYPDSISTSGAVSNAMGLTMRRFNNGMPNSAIRSSTPNELVYAQQQITTNHYPHYSPAGTLQMLPSLSNTTSGSSRPSTANSIQLSHSLSRGTPSSRPSTAGGMPSTHPFGLQVMPCPFCRDSMSVTVRVKASHPSKLECPPCGASTEILRKPGWVEEVSEPGVPGLHFMCPYPIEELGGAEQVLWYDRTTGTSRAQSWGASRDPDIGPSR